MPQFEIETNDGRVITIESDQAPTEAQALAVVQNLSAPTDNTVEPPKDPRNQTFEEFKEQERINDEKSLGEDALDLAGGVASGVGQLVGMGFGAVGETFSAVSDGEFSKILRSLPEGMAKSIFDLGEIGESIVGRVGDQFVGEEESLMRQFQRQQQDFVDADRRAEGFTANPDQVLPQLTEVASMGLDPTNLIGLGVAGKLAKASKLGSVAEGAGRILDIPSQAVKAGLGKAVQLGALGTGATLKALDKPLKAVSAVSGKVSELASKPRSTVQNITEKTLGIKSGKLGGVAKVGMIMGGPLGKMLLASEIIGKKGANLYKNSVDARHISGILANPNGRLGFLQEVATNPNISDGIRRLANMGKTQRGMDIAMNAVSNGVSAGILQGIFTKMATDDLGQIGQAIGGGMAFGGLVPVGGKTNRSTGGEARTGSKGDLPVSLDPKQRARDLEALERERQANPEKFNNEQANMGFFIDAFDSKATDAGVGRGNEGTTLPNGAKELYYARGEPQTVKNINDLEASLQQDAVSNITYVKTGAGSTTAGGQIKGSQIETITQDVSLLDFQISSDAKGNKTLTTARGINVDALRQSARETGISMDVLLNELTVLKNHVRNGGKVNDPAIKSNEIVKLINEGKKGLIVQIEPRNVVTMKDKPLGTARNAPFVAPPIPLTPRATIEADVKAKSGGLKPGEKPTPKTMARAERAKAKRARLENKKGKKPKKFKGKIPPTAPNAKPKLGANNLPTPTTLKASQRFNAKKAKKTARKKAEFRDKPSSDPENVADFTGRSVRSQTITLGANGGITAHFPRAVDRSLHFFHGIRSRKKNNAMNQRSAKPSEDLINKQQQHLADTYGLDFDEVPAFAERYNTAVKEMAKKENKKGLGEFDPPNPVDFI